MIKKALLSLIALKDLIQKEGFSKALLIEKEKLNTPSLLSKEVEEITAHVHFLDNEKNQQSAMETIDRQLIAMIGSLNLLKELEDALKNQKNKNHVLINFFKEHATDKEAIGTLFKKREVIDLQASLLKHIEDTEDSFSKATQDKNVISAMSSDIDRLTKNYHRGQQLYISQACYACHRIAGLARGGIGPELTKEGNVPLWFVKESIVWPQADLRTSTMPNYRLDHIELEDLMTFLLAQKGATKTLSETEYKVAIQEWDAGRKLPWEKPLNPSERHDLRFAMTVFATQGCASCHRLEGFQSNVGFAIEKKQTPNFEEIYREHEWFKTLIPEESLGSYIAKIVDEHAQEIDQRIVENVRENSILENIENEFPDTLESFYSNFRFASRVKNKKYEEIIKNNVDPVKKAEAISQLQKWKERMQRVLMIYIQEYGLGRLIGPKPNWSGVYRSDEWLLEHFYNPGAHVARSIMPVFPFDETKFRSLISMLDILGKRNRDAVRAIWEHKGFNPSQAYAIHCSQCHGEYRQGNGPVATWIYPIAKNLNNSEFLHNLSKSVAIQSIIHGIKGTPMPPWGETPLDKENYDGIAVLSKEEISAIVDWLFSSLSGATGRNSESIPKWEYTPQDVIEELKREGNQLKSASDLEKQNLTNCRLMISNKNLKKKLL